jgi:spore coat protein U-like protein
MRALLAAALLAALMPAGAAQACRLELRNLNDITFSGRYDPFAATQSPRSMRFSVRNKDFDVCSFGVGIDRGQNGNRLMAGDGDTLDYEIVGPDNRAIADAPATSGNGLLTGIAFTPMLPVELEVWAIVPAGQMAEAGKYDDRLTVNLYQMSGGQPGQRHDSETFEVEATVGSTMQTKLIVGGVSGRLDGRVATLDFGDLETGKTLSFDLEVAGNVPYEVRLQSENRGAFTGTDSGNRDGRITYTLSMNGRSLSLTGTAEVDVAAPHGGTLTNEHNFTVQVGDTSRALAGRYSDSLTVTVSAN